MKSHEGQQDLPGLTGLRGIAALVVFLAHNRYQDLLPGVSKGALWLEWHDLAVDLFFMLSGLVMAHVYAGKLKFSSAESWRSYAVARIARILPLYLVTTLAALAIYCLGSLWLGKWPAYLSAQVIVTNVLLLQNWPGLFCLSVNLPAWSLSVEMFCYALGIIPALLLHRYVRPRPVLAWGAIVILVACRLALSSDTTGWGSLGRGLIGFSIGAVIPPPMAVGGVVALVSALGFVVLRSMAAWAGWSAVWPMMMFPLLIWGLVGAGRTWLDGRVMRWLGDLSYSMYLWQGPIMLITYYQIRPRVMGLPLGLRVIWAAVEIALLLGVSFLSYQKLERPARRWVRQWLKEGIVTN